VHQIELFLLMSKNIDAKKNIKNKGRYSSIVNDFQNFFNKKSIYSFTFASSRLCVKYFDFL